MIINGIKFNGRGFRYYVNVADLPATKLPIVDESVQKIWIDYHKGWGWIVEDRYTHDSHKVFDTLSEAREHVVKTYCPDWQPQRKQEFTPLTVRSLVRAMIERDKLSK